jgi:hypothetical protein
MLSKFRFWLSSWFMALCPIVIIKRKRLERLTWYETEYYRLGLKGVTDTSFVTEADMERLRELLRFEK